MAKTQPTHDLRGLLVPEAGTLTATYTATRAADAVTALRRSVQRAAA